MTRLRLFPCVQRRHTGTSRPLYRQASHRLSSRQHAYNWQSHPQLLYWRREGPHMEFPDRRDVDHLIDPQPLPEFARVRYEPRTERLDDPVAATRDELDALDLDALPEGATVAVGVGSRGIDRIDEVAAAVVARRRARLRPGRAGDGESHGATPPGGSARCWRRSGSPRRPARARSIDARMTARALATVSVGDAETPVYFSGGAGSRHRARDKPREGPHQLYRADRERAREDDRRRPRQAARRGARSRSTRRRSPRDTSRR